MKISTNRGFATGLLGKIGVAVAASNPRIVYAIVQAHDGGVFRSNDAGQTWKRVNAEWKLRQRAFYYMALTVDPTNPQVVYAPQVDGIYKTSDGGKTFTLIDIPHGDNHIVWVNPHDPKLLLVGNDGGGVVSVDGGDNWSDDHNQPTGQFYHVALDDQFPFHVFGASQDEGAYEGPSAAVGPGIGPTSGTPSRRARARSSRPSPATRTLPTAADTTVLSSPQPHHRRFEEREPVAALYVRRHVGGDKVPLRLDASDLLLSGRSARAARRVAGRLLEHGPRPDVEDSQSRSHAQRAVTEGHTGGPIDNDETGAETFPDISSLAVSPLDAKILWAGSADGLVHVTTDHGATWKLVTPPQLPQWAQISSIEPSHTQRGTAFLTASRYMWDDFHPYVFETTDFGNDWIQLTNGLPGDQYVFVVRQDPVCQSALCRDAQHCIRQFRRRSSLAAAHAKLTRRSSPRLRDRLARRRARRRDARPRLLDSR